MDCFRRRIFASGDICNIKTCNIFTVLFAAHIHILHEIEIFSFLNNSLAIVNDKVYSISRTFELESTKIDLINSLKFFNMTRT